MVVCLIICIVFTALSALENLFTANLIGFVSNLFFGTSYCIGLYVLQDSKNCLKAAQEELESYKVKIITKEKSILELKIKLGEKIDTPEMIAQTKHLQNLNDDVKRQWPVIAGREDASDMTGKS